MLGYMLGYMLGLPARTPCEDSMLGIEGDGTREAALSPLGWGMGLGWLVIRLSPRLA